MSSSTGIPQTCTIAVSENPAPSMAIVFPPETVTVSGVTVSIAKVYSKAESLIEELPLPAPRTSKVISLAEMAPPERFGAVQTNSTLVRDVTAQTSPLILRTVSLSIFAGELRFSPVKVRASPLFTEDGDTALTLAVASAAYSKLTLVPAIFETLISKLPASLAEVTQIN